MALLRHPSGWPQSFAAWLERILVYSDRIHLQADSVAAVSKILARVTQSLDAPRGPDVELALRVPVQWLEQGAMLEIELPRNLACAACSGGGCDACGRSGAVTLRGRKEPAELVQVTLPRGEITLSESSDRPKVLLLRIPERGGLSETDSDLPRGHLLLSIRVGDEPDAGVGKVRRSIVPPPPAESIPAAIANAPRGRVAVVHVVLDVVLALHAWQIARARR
jgi:hypothetical protein